MIFFFDQLRCDFDEDRQKAVSRAVSNVQREVERIRHQTEGRCREEAEEGMKKLAAKHKLDVSLAKKKQWVRDVFPYWLIYLSCNGLFILLYYYYFDAFVMHAQKHEISVVCVVCMCIVRLFNTESGAPVGG